MSPPPRVAVSMGDPTGIGPEVTLAALATAGTAAAAAADPGRRPRRLRRHRRAACGSPLRFAAWAPARTAAARDDRRARGRRRYRPAQRRPGHPTLAGGRAAHAAIVEALRLVRSGVADALVHGADQQGQPDRRRHSGERPHRAAGASVRRRPGADDDDRRHACASPWSPPISRCAPCPTPSTPPTYSTTIRIADRSLRERFGIRRPRIGVAGLNPHAGEQGAFGDEEIRLIAPAVRRARRLGIDAGGPLRGRQPVPAGPRGPLRRRRLHVPRPGARAVQAAALRRRRELHRRAAGGANVARSRHRARHRRPPTRRSVEHVRRPPHGRAARRSSSSANDPLAADCVTNLTVPTFGVAPPQISVVARTASPCGAVVGWDD